MTGEKILLGKYIFVTTITRVVILINVLWWVFGSQTFDFTNRFRRTSFRDYLSNILNISNILLITIVT